MSTLKSAITLIRPGEPQGPSTWMMSDWDAGQSSLLRWSPNNVRWAADGSLELVLSKAPQGSARPWLSGEIQSSVAASTGTWSWTAQVPDLTSGSVFGMFTYRADHFNDPWIEFDFEFLGIDGRDSDRDGDTDITAVRLNIHMETPTGQHVTLEQEYGAPVLVELGFDATEGFHTYEVVVTGAEAVFLVDGGEIARFDGGDMPGGLWTTGEMKSFVNLWAVDPSLSGWAGAWSDPGRDLVARIGGLEVRPGEFGAYDPRPLVSGTAGADTLVGSGAAERLDGMGGDDLIACGLGDDLLLGGDGNDRLQLAGGNDRLEGGAGTDWVEAIGTTAVVVDLGAGTASGWGSDSLSGIENAQGAGGADRLYGSAGANVLLGGAGDDTLDGRAGVDRIVGGAGRDLLWGGADGDVFVFDARTDSAVGQKRDTIHDFVSGVDDIDLRGIDASAALAGDQAFRFSGTTAAANSVWYVAGRSEIILRADVTGDRTADLEVRLVGVKALAALDFVGVSGESLL